MAQKHENSGLMVSANELLAFQRDLKAEKEFLQNILATIDEQVHALQVEQLHLLGLMNKSMNRQSRNSASVGSINDNKEQKPVNKILDLSVASALTYFEEEMDEDEEDV